tara:strand:+ start:2718 stop:3317 length:600 start_codon:yes stop_codon:yes gene_type:complete
MKNFIPNEHANPEEGYIPINTQHFVKDWVIPFLHVSISDWDLKKESLLSVFDKFCDGRIENIGEQWTDYHLDSHYHYLVENILFNDLRDAVSALGFEGKTPRVDTAWFQIYNQGQHHAPHNHGLGGISFVVFVDFDPKVHSPTNFIAPFTSMKDGNVLEYEPKGVVEGSMILFPSALMHYAPSNQNDEDRTILAGNLRI